MVREQAKVGYGITQSNPQTIVHFWIDQPHQLTAHLQTRPALVGLDTEFVRERTYWPHLALVQIATDAHTVLLVDPLVPGMNTELAHLLRDTRVVKIMHSASEDLVALRHACGAVPTPLFDTQIAATLSGVGGGLGYQKLVQLLLGVTLSKGETRSDWMRRPLTASQLDYAADDVRHLHALHAQLLQRLVAQQRSHWLGEDCARMVANAECDELEIYPHLSLRAAQFLEAPAQMRLLRLLRWRDLQARASDVPRTWMLDNESALQLARQPPGNLAGLQADLERMPRAPRKLAPALWHALSTPLADEPHAPLARSDDRNKKELRKLQEIVSSLSAQLALADGVLASRRWLEPLLDGHDWPGALSGWRRAILEPHLSPLLPAGRAVDTSV